MSHIEEIPCIEVLSSVVFIIEGVAEESQNPHAKNTRSPCAATVYCYYFSSGRQFRN
jgi:hypothetical protein